MENTIDKNQVFSEKTLMPVSLIITIIGGVVWLTTLWNVANVHTEKINKLEIRDEFLINELSKGNREIFEKLIRIEEQLKQNNKNQKGGF